MRVSFYKLLLRPILFRFDAERVHEWMLAVAGFFWRRKFGRALTRLWYQRGLRFQPVRLAGLELRSAVGLAAGFDKDARLVPGIENLGFGFVEIGTVTPRPQDGNPKPRLSRIPEKRAILNRMGFNNAGADALAARMRAIRQILRVPLGINLGKNKDTPNSAAVDDYEILFRKLGGLGDYYVVNISSPNTPGLRDLQSMEFVAALGEALRKQRFAQPVFLKLSPAIPSDDLKAICGLCGPSKAYTGLILTNTIPTDLGGISGAPLKGPSMQLLKQARKELAWDVPVISVGGIETAEDVRDRLDAGATAVQIYSSMIYQGPSLVRKILLDLQNRKN